MSESRATGFQTHDVAADLLAVEQIAAIPAILDVVCRTTGMGFAAVARVTEDRWIVCGVRDSIDFGLEPGGELKVETTICHEIRQARAAVVIDEVALDPVYRGHPTPALYGFQSYISMPIVLPNGSFFGTLCAIDPKPAKLNTPAVVGMFKMFADLIGFHLDAHQNVATSTAALQLYRNIVQSDHAPICVFDSACRLIAFNKAHSDEFYRIYAYRVQIGDVFPDLFLPDQAVIMRGFMERALRGEIFSVVEEFGNPGLVKPYWEVAYSPLRDDTGRIIGAFHHAQDISARLRAEAELKGAQEALRQSQKMEVVGQLTGGVAHDFNNLLTVIKSSTDLLKRPDLPENRRARYINAISDTVDRAAKLTGQLLAFARRQALKPEVFAACESVRDVVEMMGTLTGSRIRIVTKLPEERAFVNADPNQFDTALVNMAVNARDAMAGEGQLTIAVEVGRDIPGMHPSAVLPGLFVAVSISDTGSGIPAEQLERIFEPFFTTKDVGQGTGLGLSQVYGFAHQSGGEILVTSEVGKGTTFTLYLPHVPAPSQATEAPSEPESLVDGHGTCVLVVEDNTDVGTFATQTLTELGYITVWSVNGEDALAELAKNADRFDVIFSDVVMPGMGGIALGQQVRQRYADLPVVLTSGYSHVLAQKGTDGFELLHKPYSVEQLSRVLRKAAAPQRRKRALVQ